MHAVESQWWILDLPEEWNAVQEDDAIVITDRDGVGEIVVTTLQKTAGEVCDAELRAHAEGVTDEFGPGQAIRVAETSGYYFRFIDQGEAVREWYLRHGDLFLLVTYCCDVENAGMDDAAVDEILSTLYVKQSDPGPSVTH